MKFTTKPAMEKAAIEVLEKCHRRFGNQTWGQLMKAHEKGKTGWDDPAWSVCDMQEQLMEAFREKRWLDVSNFALFLWNREDDPTPKKEDYVQK